MRSSRLLYVTFFSEFLDKGVGNRVAPINKRKIAVTDKFVECEFFGVSYAVLAHVAIFLPSERFPFVSVLPENDYNVASDCFCFEIAKSVPEVVIGVDVGRFSRRCR